MSFKELLEVIYFVFFFVIGMIVGLWIQSFFNMFPITPTGINWWSSFITIMSGIIGDMIAEGFRRGEIVFVN